MNPPVCCSPGRARRRRTRASWRSSRRSPRCAACAPTSPTAWPASACGVVADPDLVEWDYGIYEGRTTFEIREEEPAWSVFTNPMKGGESIEDVGVRVDRFLAGMMSELESGNAAIFAHGHVLAILIARWCDLAPIEGRRFPLATATVSLLGWHREDHVIRALNHRAGDTLDPPSRT